MTKSTLTSNGNKNLPMRPSAKDFLSRATRSSEGLAEKLPCELSEAYEDDLQRLVPLAEEAVGGVGSGCATGALGASKERDCSLGRYSFDELLS